MAGKNNGLLKYGGIFGKRLTHVNMFICKPLDYIITGSSNCLRDFSGSYESSRDCGKTEGIGSSSASLHQ